MESDRGLFVGRELIDFASSPPSRGLEFNARLSVGAVTLTHCTSGPIEGRQLGAAQITAAIHDGVTFDMDRRGGESDRLRSSTVSHGRVHVGDGRLPFWVRCNASPSFFAFAIEESFVTEIWRKAFDGIGDCFIGTSIGVEDPVIGRLAALGRHELNEGGAGGRLYLEDWPRPWRSICYAALDCRGVCQSSIRVGLRRGRFGAFSNTSRRI